MKNSKILKFIAFITIITLLISFVSAVVYADASQDAVIAKGDINNDGNADVLDLLKMKQHILKMEILENPMFDTADINDDGEVNAMDLLIMKKYILKIINNFDRFIMEPHFSAERFLTSNPFLEWIPEKYLLTDESGFNSFMEKYSCENLNNQIYDSEYFSENILALYLVPTGSGMITYSNESVKIENNKVYCTVDVNIPEICTDDMAMWIFILEISKEEYKNNPEIEIVKTNVYENPGLYAVQPSFKIERFATENWQILWEENEFFINNKIEFDSFMNKYDCKNLDISKYTDNYFSENTLILYFFPEGSGSINHYNGKVKIENNKIVCTSDVYLPEVGTCDMAMWIYILEVSKEDYKNNPEIEIIKTKIKDSVTN